MPGPSGVQISQQREKILAKLNESEDNNRKLREQLYDKEKRLEELQARAALASELEHNIDDMKSTLKVSRGLKEAKRDYRCYTTLLPLPMPY